MQIIARFVISLEKLIKNPVDWFSSQSWLLRLVLVVLLVPSIGVISIIGYQRFYLDQNDTNAGSCEELSQEISNLRKDLERFNDSQMEELVYLNEGMDQLKKASAIPVSEESEGDLVLGVDDDKVASNLRERLENIDLTATDSKLIYIKNEVESADVFEEPSTSAKKLITLEPGSFHPALLEESDWQQIYLGEGQSGWIKKEVIIKFSTNENN